MGIIAEQEARLQGNNKKYAESIGFSCIICYNWLMHTDQKQKKLLLVFPKTNYLDYSDFSRNLSFFIKKKGGPVPVSLATVAALTPPGFSITIMDENIEALDYAADFDLVGITGYATHLQRVREISLAFKKRGRLVVCGGVGVSTAPERWRNFADVLIIGEAENTWPQFCRDYLAGTYRNEYRKTGIVDLKQSPLPDFRFYSPAGFDQYTWGTVQTSRGCPYNCEYCSVVVYLGHKMRYKSPDQVLAEVQQLVRLGLGRMIFLSDDNFAGDPARAKEILKVLADWNRRRRKPVSFMTQLSITCARDDEFLELAAAAGLLYFIIGIETGNRASLEETHKYQNMQTDVIAAIRKIASYGIMTACGCMVGFDNDDLSIFRAQFDFFSGTAIPNVEVFPLQAFDGTPLKRRMAAEKRYLDYDAPENRTAGEVNLFNTATIIPRQMTIGQLKDGTWRLLSELYREEHFTDRYAELFRIFRESFKRRKPVMPGMAIDKEGIILVLRLCLYLLFRAAPEERRAFRKMLRCTIPVKRHSQRFVFLVYCWLTFKSTRELAAQLIGKKI